MALGDGSMFPLVDRGTPLIDKAVERGSGKHVGRTLGKIVAMGMLADPADEEMEEKANNLLHGFGMGLADELEIADEAIDERQVQELGRFLFGADVEEFLTDEAKKELGIGIIDADADDSDSDDDGGGGEGAEVDDEDDSPSFS